MKKLYSTLLSFNLLLIAWFGNSARAIAYEGTDFSTDNWFVDLILVTSDGTYRDIVNRVGVKPGAAEDRDGYDADYFTPFQQQYGVLYFPHDEWSPAAKLDYDYRSSGWTTEVWNFTVWDWGVGGSWELHWPNISNLPGNVKLSLTESDTSIVLVEDLRSASGYAFSLAQYTSRNFALVAHVVTDTKVPELTAGITPTAGLSDYIQVYVFPDEPLGELSLTIDGTDIPLESNPGDYNVSQGLWHPTATGSYSLNFIYQDLAGNSGTTTIQMTLGRATVNRFTVPALGCILEKVGTSPLDAWWGIGVVEQSSRASTQAKTFQLVLPPNPSGVIYRFYPPLDNGNWQVELNTGLGRHELPLLRDPTSGKLYVEVQESGQVTFVSKTVSQFPVDQPSMRVERLFPNPFNNHLIVSLKVNSAAATRVELFDLKGRLVRTIFQGQLLPGSYRFRWDGTDDLGLASAGGVYFLRLVSAGKRETYKVLYLK